MKKKKEPPTKNKTNEKHIGDLWKQRYGWMTDEEFKKWLEK